MLELKLYYVTFCPGVLVMSEKTWIFNKFLVKKEKKIAWTDMASLVNGYLPKSNTSQIINHSYRVTNIYK